MLDTVFLFQLIVGMTYTVTSLLSLLSGPTLGAKYSVSHLIPLHHPSWLPLHTAAFRYTKNQFHSKMLLRLFQLSGGARGRDFSLVGFASRL